MFGVERLQIIREAVIKNKSIEVIPLSKKLGVSEVTIRRDVDKLEKEGLVVKTYGGAILVNEKTSILDHDIKHIEEEPLYDKVTLDIVNTAAKLIQDGDTIFLEGSILGQALAREIIVKENLIIVTNNIEIAYKLFTESSHKVVILGGELNSLGDVNEYEQLEELLIEKVFISVDGIDLDVGYTVSDKNILRLYKQLKKVTKDLVIMANHQVFDKRGLVRLTKLEDINTVVTDKYIPSHFKTYYYENNIKVHAGMLANI